MQFHLYWKKNPNLGAVRIWVAVYQSAQNEWLSITRALVLPEPRVKRPFPSAESGVYVVLQSNQMNCEKTIF